MPKYFDEQEVPDIPQHGNIRSTPTQGLDRKDLHL